MPIRSSRRILHLAAFALLSLSALSAQAGPEEDYQKGAKAYGQGDVVTAMPLLQAAADAGHSAAQSMYALILDRSDFNEEAAAYYLKSAEQGNAEGQFGYGSMLAAGKGIARDLLAARSWIAKASAQGHKMAINEMAMAYLHGHLGVTEEERRAADALRWIRPAAENDFVPALEAMAAAYRTGAYGLAADPQQAEEWATRSKKVQGLLNPPSKRRRR